MDAFLLFLGSLGAAPIMLSLINRTKAVAAGRQGPPLLQPYWDILKLFRKGAVYSTTAGWIFRAGPVAGVACTVLAMSMVPFGNVEALISFRGDFICIIYLLGLSRFISVLSALDTGSSFEGMGASREVQYASFTEPVLLISFATLAIETGGSSLSTMLIQQGADGAALSAAVLLLVLAALFVALLSENSRVPFDDPNTHLELTMVHEVMVLDHGGPDLALIEVASALKLWLFASVIAGIVVPAHHPWGAALFAVGMTLVAVAVGLVESIIARAKLAAVPRLLTTAAVLATLSAAFTIV